MWALPSPILSHAVVRGLAHQLLTHPQPIGLMQFAGSQVQDFHSTLRREAVDIRLLAHKVWNHPSPPSIQMGEHGPHLEERGAMPGEDQGLVTPF